MGCFGASGLVGGGCSGCLGSGAGCLSDSAFFSSRAGSGLVSFFPPLCADGSGFSPPALGEPPSSMRTRSCPTVTVSSSLTRNSLMVPASGALTATSIYVLSVLSARGAWPPVVPGRIARLSVPCRFRSWQSLRPVRRIRQSPWRIASTFLPISIRPSAAP